jgi:hypothetical protein
MGPSNRIKVAVVTAWLLVLAATSLFTVSQAHAREAISQPPMEHIQLAYWPERVEATREWARSFYETETFQPQMIVEHWTGSTVQQGAIDFWNANAQQPWAQFIIDAEGHITQIGDLNVIAKQATGVSPWAIGIEHVGVSVPEIMGHPPQRRASFQLTCWLRERFHIGNADVLGHAEVRSSRFFHLTQAGWDWIAETGYQFHEDFPHGSMVRYRRHLRRACGGRS